MKTHTTYDHAASNAEDVEYVVPNGRIGRTTVLKVSRELGTYLRHKAGEIRRKHDLYYLPCFGSWMQCSQRAAWPLLQKRWWSHSRIFEEVTFHASNKTKYEMHGWACIARIRLAHRPHRPHRLPSILDAACGDIWCQSSQTYLDRGCNKTNAAVLMPFAHVHFGTCTRCRHAPVVLFLISNKS